LLIEIEILMTWLWDSQLRLRCEATEWNQKSYRSRKKACFGCCRGTPNQFAVFESITYQVNGSVSRL